MCNGKDTRECRECGASLAGRHHRTRFCNNHCKEAFNNRRWARGTELYDFLMATRYERDEKEAWNVLTSLAMGYRDQDKAVRDGRMSWVPFKEAMEKLGRLPGCADGR
jgi:hypothetical protein